jgi:hypothetical protein
MADKRPFRGVFTAGSVTSLSEFQAGDTIHNDHLKSATTTVTGIVKLATTEETFAGTTDAVVTCESLNGIRGIANGIASLDESSKLPMAQLPPHSHLSGEMGSVDFTMLTNIPSPRLTLTGDVSGSAIFNNMADATLTVAINDNSHTHGDSTLVDIDWSKLKNIPSASQTTPGIVELATDVETMAGLDNTRAVSPLSLKSIIGMNNGTASLDSTGKMPIEQLPPHNHTNNEVTSIDWSKIANIPLSSETTAGIITLGTRQEVIDGTLSNRAVSPFHAAAVYAKKTGDRFTGRVGITSGSSIDATAPRLYFDYGDNDNDTGFYTPGKGIISFACNGVEAARVFSSGKMSINTEVEKSHLTVNGNIELVSNLPLIRIKEDTTNGNIDIFADDQNSGVLYLSHSSKTNAGMVFGRKDSAGAFTTEMLLGPTGNLSLNTFTNSERLNINGNVLFTGSENKVIFVKDSTNGNVVIDEELTDIRIAHNTSATSEILFGSINSSDVFTTQVKITNDGKLCVGGTAGTTGFINTTGDIYLNGNNRKLNIFQSATDGDITVEANSNSLQLSHNNNASSIISFGKRIAGGTFTEQVRINNTGDLLVGTTSNNGKLTVEGAIVAGTDDTYSLGTPGIRWKDIYATNATIQTSDLRKKGNIENSDLGLNFVLELRPVSYKWKDNNDNQKHYGLIAQEVKTLINKCSSTFAGFVYDEANDIYGLRYNEFISPIIKAIQELAARVEALEEKS